MIGHFEKKSLFLRDTRDHQEHDAKVRLPIPSPSPEKLKAEIIQLKKKLTSVIAPHLSQATLIYPLFRRSTISFDQPYWYVYVKSSNKTRQDMGLWYS